MERRSTLINAKKTPDRERLDPDAVYEPGMWEPVVPTVNPEAEELRYDPAAEAQDVAAKLDRYASEALEGVPGQEILGLDMERAFRISQETGREFQTAEENYIIAALRLLIERHLWGPRFFNDVSVQLDGQGNGGSFDTVARVLNDLRVTQRLPYGGDVSAGLLLSATDQLRDRATGAYRQAGDLIFAANIPLLRGAGLVAREGLIQAERDLIYEARDFEAFRREYLVSIARDYFDLLQRKAEIANQVRQIESLRGLERATAARVDAGRVAEFNLALVRNRVLGAQSALSSLRESYLFALDRFKIRLGLPVTEPIEVAPIALELPPPDVSLEGATEQALLYRLDLQNRRDQLDDARRSVAIAENQLLPDLDFAADVNVPTDPDDRTPGLDFRGGEAGYRTSLTLSLPLDRRIERLRLRETTIRYEQALREFNRFRDEVVLAVRQSVRNIDQARFELELAEERVRINSRRLEEQRLKSDEVDPQTIVDTENDLLESENQRDRAVTALRTAILDFLLESGQLRVERDGTFKPLPGMDPPPAPPAPPAIPIPAADDQEPAAG